MRCLCWFPPDLLLPHRYICPILSLYLPICPSLHDAPPLPIVSNLPLSPPYHIWPTPFLPTVSNPPTPPLATAFVLPPTPPSSVDSDGGSSPPYAGSSRVSPVRSLLQRPPKVLVTAGRPPVRHVSASLISTTPVSRRVMGRLVAARWAGQSRHGGVVSRGTVGGLVAARWGGQSRHGGWVSRGTVGWSVAARWVG